MADHPIIAEPFAWVGAHELAAPLPDPSWAVEGLQMGPGRPVMIAAYAGTAKTIAAQSLALAYAAGLEVWGAFPTKGGTARHLDYEQGSYATRRRYQRLAFGLGLSLETMDPDRLQLLSFPPFYLRPSDSDAWERAIYGCGLVVVDSFRAATPGADENTSDVRQHVDTLTRISERTGATVLLIHHAGKTKQGGGSGDPRQAARGSSALLDAVGCAFLLEMSSYSAPRRMRQTKMPAEADGESVPDGELLIQDVEGPSGRAHGLRIVWRPATFASQRSPSQTLSDAEDRLEDAIRTAGNGGVSKRRLRALVRGSRTVFDAALEAVIASGRVECAKAVGRSGGGMVYRLKGAA